MDAILNDKRTQILDTMARSVSTEDIELLDLLLTEMIELAVDHAVVEPPVANVDVASVEVIQQMLTETITPLQNTIADMLLAFVPPTKGRK